MQRSGNILTVIIILILLAGAGYYLFFRSAPAPGPTPGGEPAATSTPQYAYRNGQYGFYFETLPAGWTTYKVATSTWDGYMQINGQNTLTDHGPVITLKDTRAATSTGSSWQDIPVMVFTIEQWNKDLIVSAAPVGPTELGRNNKYVFALPPRAIGFAADLGVREVDDWMRSNPLRTFNVP